jgi:hypothetical protein
VLAGLRRPQFRHDEALQVGLVSEHPKACRLESPYQKHLTLLKSQTMRKRVLCTIAGLCAAISVAAALPGSTGTAFAQNGGDNNKPAEKNPAPPAAAPAPAQKVEEYAEIQHNIAGPAGNPECVWLGRRVVSLLWRDDIETAFRHLDLYDRFGCPSGHIQATFRCLILHSNSVDPKSPDSLNGRVNACWLNPSDPAPPPPPAAAAAPSSTTNR